MRLKDFLEQFSLKKCFGIVLKWTKKRKKPMLMGFSILLIVGGIYFWSSLRRYVSTEDAYINGNIVQIAARVTGQVQQLYVDNHQFIKEGQVLFEIDKRPFEVAVEQAQAQYLLEKTKLKYAETTFARTQALVKNEVVSRQAGDDVEASLSSARAAVTLSEAKLKEARLRLSYTTVIAPTSGWVNNLSLRIGNIVSENQPIFALIDNKLFWVDANFKETELENIKKDQRAIIKIDMYPNHKFLGVVTSISGGSGTAFSLMPPQNATGNWVKVTQRIPVRVQIINPEKKFPLRLGSSAKVTIDLQSINSNAEKKA